MDTISKHDNLTTEHDATGCFTPMGQQKPAPKLEGFALSIAGRAMDFGQE